jgi:hypothetical protein
MKMLCCIFENARYTWILLCMIVSRAIIIGVNDCQDQK